MEILLNRWRGTGKIYKFLTGAILYGLYIGLLLGLITQNILVGLLTIGLFLLGESFGWGKWVGSLCYPEKQINLQKNYDDLEGYNFPYIHYVANAIVKERLDYHAYCQIALFFRGSIWGLCIYLALVIFNYISIFDYILISLTYGIGFPLACHIATLKSFNYKNRFISIVGRWETQEIYYGAVHFICNMYIILKYFI